MLRIISRAGLASRLAPRKAATNVCFRLILFSRQRSLATGSPPEKPLEEVEDELNASDAIGARLMEEDECFVDDINEGEIGSPPVADFISYESLLDLHSLLPTRRFDGGQLAFTKNLHLPVPQGHHLIYFHRSTLQSYLREDGTPDINSPPYPWTRRMWAGGKMRWNCPRPEDGLLTRTLSVFRDGKGSARITGVERGKPMLFWNQRLEYFRIPDKMDVAELCDRDTYEPLLKALDTLTPVIEEERTHVYLQPFDPSQKRAVKQVEGLPKPEHTFEWRPTPATLFQFSALTMNAHRIHLDKEYAISEGYSERLVHGPLTAVMLLEAARAHGGPFKSFEYTAMNPLVVNRPIAVRSARVGTNELKVWAEDAEDGTVGMVGHIHVQSDTERL